MVKCIQIVNTIVVSFYDKSRRLVTYLSLRGLVLIIPHF